MLPSDQLSALRSDLATFLTESAQVQRATTASDGYGGQTASWGLVATVSALRTTTGLRPDERVIAERLTAHQTFVILMPSGTDVRNGDRVVIGTRTFEVVAVLSGGFEVLRRVMVVEVT